MPNETPEVEGTTFALWPLDSDREDSFVVTDEKSQLTLISGATSDVADGRPWIQGGSGGVGTFARWSNGDRWLRQDDNSGPGAALLTGDWTLQFRLYLEALPETSSSYNVLNYSATGESEASNNVLQITISDAGEIELFWEYNSGVNQQFFLTNTIVPIKQWFTLSLRCSVSAPNRTISVYIDDTQPDSSITGVNASGGDNSDWGIMGRVPQNDRQIRGGLAAMRISSVDLGDAQVKADAALHQYTDQGANTWSLINFTDPPEVTDLAGVYHLNRAALYTTSAQATGTVESTEGLICAGDRARAFTLSTDWLEGANTHRIRDVLKGEWTLELWLRHDPDQFSDIGLMEWYDTDETEAENTLARIYLDRSGSAWKPHFLWERGAGINEDHVAANDLLDEVRGGAKNHLFLHHLAFVFVDNGGTRDIRIYIDGVLNETLVTGGALPTGGEDSEHLRFGISSSSTAANSAIAWVHIHNAALDTATIAAHYEAQRKDCSTPPSPPVDTVPPIVNNYDPPPNTAIANTEEVEFDVTDDTGLFCKIIMTAHYANTGLWELVHDGVSFAPRYSFGVSRTPITNGFHYVLRRVGGWSLSPTIITYAVDLGGNEAT